MLPYELILEIITYSSNKESYYLAITSKTIYKSLKHRGFAKHIHYDHFLDNDIFKCLSLIEKHKHSLNTIVINRLDNPHLWLPPSYWVENMIFNCYFSENIKLKKDVKTKHLIINNSKSNKISIELKQLPYIESIILVPTF